MRKRTIIITIIILALLAGGWYGYSEYTRKVKPLSKVSADFKSNASTLIREFETDESAANVKYLGKIIEVSGSVKQIDTNERGNIFLILGEQSSMSAVRCSMDSTMQDKAKDIVVGNRVLVKGACTGFTADELLGSDLILNRCVVVN